VGGLSERLATSNSEDKSDSVIMSLFLKFALALALTCATAIAAIRAQPYDDHNLRALLSAPDGCSAPCWQGIRPGVTTGTEASRLLETNAWVGNVDYYVDLNALVWEWSGEQPDWIDDHQRGVVSFDVRSVRYVRIYTRIAFGDLWLALGTPEQNLIESSGFRNVVMIEHNATYFGGTLHAIRNPLPCAIPISDYWGRRVEILLAYNRGAGTVFVPDSGEEYNPYHRPYC
jgi:hypothetical protein